MTNKPKAKGTAAESAFVAYLRETGFPYAERRSLQGALDKGDVTGTPGICWEVKVADRGFQFGPWLRETEVEQANAKADFGVLICKPKGMGAQSVGSWVAAMKAGPWLGLQLSMSWDMFSVPNTVGIHRELARRVDGMATYKPPGRNFDPADYYVMVQVRSVVESLRLLGYGTPLVRDPEVPPGCV